MYKRILRKRILKGLVVSLALFAVIPISNTAAKPVSVGQPDPWFETLVTNQRYQQSQQSQLGVSGPELAAMNARGDFLNKKYGLGQYASRSSEISTGLTGETFGPTKQELAAMNARGEFLNKKYSLGQYAFGPTEQELNAMNARGDFLNKKYGLGQYAVEPSNTGSEIPWSSAGIGVGIAALLIAGTAGALVVRSRQHGGLAH